MNPVSFQNDRCLNCDTPITQGILCTKCTVSGPSQTIDRDDISLGWPEMEEEIDYFGAEIV